MLRAAAALLAFAIIAAAQCPRDEVESTPVYTAFREFSLSSGSFLLTLQAPAKSGRRIHLCEVVVWSSAQIDVEQIRNGTLSGGTAITPTPTSVDDTPAATAYYGGSLSSGTAYPGPWTIPASQHFGFDVQRIVMRKGADGAQSYAIRSTGAVNATVRVAVSWYEKGR